MRLQAKGSTPFPDTPTSLWASPSARMANTSPQRAGERLSSGSGMGSRSPRSRSWADSPGRFGAWPLAPTANAWPPAAATRAKGKSRFGMRVCGNRNRSFIISSTASLVTLGKLDQRSIRDLRRPRLSSLNQNGQGDAVELVIGTFERRGSWSRGSGAESVKEMQNEKCKVKSAKFEEKNT